MAKISELPEKKVTTEYIVIDGKKYHFDEVKFNISKKFLNDLENKALRHQLEVDPWMDLMQDFYEQIYSNPAITVSEFIEKMKEKFNLEHNNK